MRQVGAFARRLLTRSIVRLSLPIAVALCSAACAGMNRPSGGFDGANPGSTEVSGEASLEARMLALVNSERSRRGIHQITNDQDLTIVARRHSHDMIEAGFVGHVSPTQGEPVDRIDRADYPARVLRENVALHQTVEGAHEILMDSQAHRESILAEDVTVAGIGIVRSNSDLFVTQLFADPIRTQDPVSMRETFIGMLSSERRDAGLEPLPIHSGLQAVAEEQVRRLPVELESNDLGPVTRDALQVIRERPDLRRVDVAAQPSRDERDLSLPAAALTADARALGVAAREARDDRGRPTLLLLIIVASG